MIEQQEVKALGVRFPLFKDRANIKAFAELHKVSETEAVRLIVQRYFKLSFASRSALEKKERTLQHTTKGLRRLSVFAQQPRAKTHLLPQQASTTNQTATS